MLRGNEFHRAVVDVFEDAMGILPPEGTTTDRERREIGHAVKGTGLSNLEKAMGRAALAAVAMLLGERERSRAEAAAALEAAPESWMARLVSLKWRYTYDDPAAAEPLAWSMYQESQLRPRLLLRSASSERAARVDVAVGQQWAAYVHLESVSYLEPPSEEAIDRARTSLATAERQDLPPEMPARLSCLIRLNRLHADGKHDEVLQVIADWAARCTEDPDKGDPDEFLSERIEALTALGRIDEAIADCRVLYTSRDDSLDYLLEEARLLKDKEDWQGSYDACAKYVAKRPDDPEGYVARANAAYNLGKYEEVEADARKALALDPAAAQAWLALGFAKLQLNEADEALPMFERILEKGPNPDALLGKGKCLAMEDRFFEAMEVFNKAREADPENPSVYYEMADTLFLMGYFDEATRYATKCLSLDAQFAGAYVVLGMIASRMRQDEKADRLIDLALRYDPTNPFALNEKAFSLHSEGRDDEAMVCVDKAIAEFPTYSDAFCTKGMILYYKSDFSEAMRMFDQALQYTPEHLAAMTGKANVLVQEGAYDEAMRLFDTVLKQEPAFAEALSGKATLLRLLGLEDEAREYTERANRAYDDGEDEDE